MKLQTFNQETTPKLEKQGSPKVSFGKSGTLFFNKAAVQLMALKNEDKIAISQDEDSPNDWYVHLDPKGFPLRPNSKVDSLMVNHSDLVRTWKKSFELEDKKTYSCLIAGEPTKVNKVNYWCILVANFI